MSASYILLKGGTLLIHDENKHVIPRRADLLIQNDRIKLIEVDIRVPDGATIIDCHDSIISPGLIDTHKHMWQSQQKGLHADQKMLDYFYSGNLAASHYSPDDVFWGVLASAMESVDAGSTTVVDHAHMNYSPEHSKEAIRATITSGIRSTFCYCAHPRVTSWKPTLDISRDLFPDWSMSTFKKLASIQPFGPNGRVRLGFAMDIMYVPSAVLRNTYAIVREHGVNLITSHASRIRAVHDAPSAITVLQDNELLGPDVLLSHANQASKDELDYLKRSGAHLSSTPLSEMQMGHGHPICLEEGFAGLSSMGTDSNGICTSYIPAQMRVVLQDTRARHTEIQIKNQLPEISVGPTAEDVYNLGTLLGAEAIGLDHEIGSLRVGKKADIVIFNGRSPSMISVSERNPVAAIVLYSSERDIQTVVIDGVIRKKDFHLEHVPLAEGIQREDVDPSRLEALSWREVAVKLDESRKKLEAIVAESVDEESVRKNLTKSVRSISVTKDAK